jgi:carboxyl-terminal processing protease
MGERSFGKGSVQTLIDIDGTTALRLTTARYYTPSGRSVQEGGIEPDITVPQLSDPDYKVRPKFRETDLGRHLINQNKVDNASLEADDKVDPRFSQTAEQLKAKGILDFQLDYAVKAVGRLPKQGIGQAVAPVAKKKAAL